jgi:hypothetical protein
MSQKARQLRADPAASVGWRKGAMMPGKSAGSPESSPDTEKPVTTQQDKPDLNDGVIR